MLTALKVFAGGSVFFNFHSCLCEQEQAAHNAVAKLSDAPAGSKTMRYFIGDAFEYLERHTACSKGFHAAHGNATVQPYFSQTAPLTEVPTIISIA